VTEQTAEFTFGSWSAPAAPVAIEYPLEVMDEIRAAAADGLQKLARGGLEVAGVLFGVQRETGIRILTWRPIACEYALGPTLQLSERDRAGLTRLLETAEADQDLQGLKPVGWFLSHTRSDILLSPSDLEIFYAFFPQPWQVTLVLHPTQAGPARAGFFVRDADGALKSDSSYQEFDVKPLRRAARPPDPLPPITPEPVSSRRNTEALLALPMTTPFEGRAAHSDPPLFRTLERSRTPRGWLWMLPVILGLIVTGLFVKERFLAPRNQPFSLHVSDAGESVQIEWDRNAASIRNSHIGVIDIKDGGETKRYSLADDDLHAGKMSYLRRGGDLELRMTVYPEGSTAMQEFAHFLDPGPAVPAPNPTSAPATVSTSEIDQLRQERDRLNTQVKQLKEDLRKERSRRGRFR
jgi:hypothetical protein